MSVLQRSRLFKYGAESTVEIPLDARRPRYMTKRLRLGREKTARISVSGGVIHVKSAFNERFENFALAHLTKKLRREFRRAEDYTVALKSKHAPLEILRDHKALCRREKWARSIDRCAVRMKRKVKCSLLQLYASVAHTLPLACEKSEE